uniref:Uncharacterized protein n=1 Tax=Physcomitrium patens TaxID=3218 RepID=A0A7I4ENM4_PHYPA
MSLNTSHQSRRGRHAPKQCSEIPSLPHTLNCSYGQHSPDLRIPVASFLLKHHSLVNMG